MVLQWYLPTLLQWWWWQMLVLLLSLCVCVGTDQILIDCRYHHSTKKWDGFRCKNPRLWLLCQSFHLNGVEKFNSITLGTFGALTLSGFTLFIWLTVRLLQPPPHHLYLNRGVHCCTCTSIQCCAVQVPRIRLPSSFRRATAVAVRLAGSISQLTRYSFLSFSLSYIAAVAVLLLSNARCTR